MECPPFPHVGDPGHRFLCTLDVVCTPGLGATRQLELDQLLCTLRLCWSPKPDLLPASYGVNRSLLTLLPSGLCALVYTPPAPVDSVDRFSNPALSGAPPPSGTCGRANRCPRCDVRAPGSRTELLNPLLAPAPKEAPDHHEPGPHVVVTAPSPNFFRCRAGRSVAVRRFTSAPAPAAAHIWLHNCFWKRCSNI